MPTLNAVTGFPGEMVGIKGALIQPFGTVLEAASRGSTEAVIPGLQACPSSDPPGEMTHVSSNTTVV